MSAQTSYGFATPKGVAGGLLDISPYSIDTRVNNEAAADSLKYGMGVVQGDTAGVGVRKPISTDTAAVFEGIVMTGFSNQQTIEGNVNILPNQSVGILRYGKAWARIKSGDTPAYGGKLYLIINGADAGLFTTTSSVDTIEVKGRFIGSKGSGDIAPVELFNQAQA